MPEDAQEQAGSAAKGPRSRDRGGKPPEAPAAAKEEPTPGEGDAAAATDASPAGEQPQGDGASTDAPKDAPSDGAPASPQASSEGGGTRDSNRQWTVAKLLERGHHFLGVAQHDVAGALSGLEADATMTFDQAKAAVEDWLRRPVESKR